MARLNDDMEQHTIGGKGDFTFSGVGVTKLGAMIYTLVTIAVDVTGSVEGFEKLIYSMLQNAVEGCRKSPRRDNLLIRVIYFSDQFPNGVFEVHGFKLLPDIKVDEYPQIMSAHTPRQNMPQGAVRVGGMTPLNDALYSSVGSTNTYAATLSACDYIVNGIEIGITDGEENRSKSSKAMVAGALAASVTGEILESNISILVGINTNTDKTDLHAEERYKRTLEAYRTETGITHFVDAGDATPQKLAKLAEFVSRSVDSQAQAANSGGPSKDIDLTI